MFYDDFLGHRITTTADTVTLILGIYRRSNCSRGRFKAHHGLHYGNAKYDRSPVIFIRTVLILESIPSFHSLCNAGSANTYLWHQMGLCCLVPRSGNSWGLFDVA